MSTLVISFKLKALYCGLNGHNHLRQGVLRPILNPSKNEVNMKYSKHANVLM